jgi:hypothetical protein
MSNTVNAILYVFSDIFLDKAAKRTKTKEKKQMYNVSETNEFKPVRWKYLITNKEFTNKNRKI